MTASRPITAASRKPIACSAGATARSSTTAGRGDRPGYWAAHNMLADLLREAGPSAARSSTTKGRRHQAGPRAGAAQSRRLLLEQGRANEALDAVWRALALQDTEETRELFVQCVRDATAASGRAAVSRSHDPRPGGGLGAPGRARERGAHAGQRRTARSAPPSRRSTACGRGGCTEHPRALHAGADAGRAAASRDGSDAGLRRGTGAAAVLHPHLLLDAALDPAGDIAPEMLPFCCALARQCFINEYVFHLPDVERDGMVALRGKLMADLSGTPAGPRPHADCLCVLRAAAPLDRTAAILTRDWPPPMHGLLDQQMREPEEEARLSRRHRRADPDHGRDLGAGAPAIRGESLSALGAARAGAAGTGHRRLPARRVSARRRLRERGPARPTS